MPGSHGQVLVRGVKAGGQLATIDAEIGKIGPGPKGCGTSSAVVRTPPPRNRNGGAHRHGNQWRSAYIFLA